MIFEDIKELCCMILKLFYYFQKKKNMTQKGPIYYSSFVLYEFTIVLAASLIFDPSPRHTTRPMMRGSSMYWRSMPQKEVSESSRPSRGRWRCRFRSLPPGWSHTGLSVCILYDFFFFGYFAFIRPLYRFYFEIG